MFKIFISVFLSREFKHDEANRAWWTGVSVNAYSQCSTVLTFCLTLQRWWNRGMGGHAWSQPAREYIALYRTLVPAATPMPALALASAQLPQDTHGPQPACQPDKPPVRTPARRRTGLPDAVRAHAVARAARAEKIRA